MKLLLIGDIVGKPGRQIVVQCIRGLVLERGLDLVVANAENAAGSTHDGRLDIELQQDVAHARSCGHPNADLASALHHAHQHDVHDTDTAHQE